MTRVVRFGADEWTLPEYVREAASAPASCRSCGSAILWTVTAKGKRAPLNADGSSHFSTCPQAAKWRTPR